MRIRKMNSNLKDEHITFVHSEMYNILEKIRAEGKKNGHQISFPTASYWLAMEIKKKNIFPTIDFSIRFRKKKGGFVL